MGLCILCPYGRYELVIDQLLTCGTAQNMVRRGRTRCGTICITRRASFYTSTAKVQRIFTTQAMSVVSSHIAASGDTVSNCDTVSWWCYHNVPRWLSFWFQCGFQYSGSYEFWCFGMATLWSKGQNMSMSSWFSTDRYEPTYVFIATLSSRCETKQTTYLEGMEETLWTKGGDNDGIKIRNHRNGRWDYRSYLVCTKEASA